MSNKHCLNVISQFEFPSTSIYVLTRLNKRMVTSLAVSDLTLTLNSYSYVTFILIFLIELRKKYSAKRKNEL